MFKRILGVGLIILVGLVHWNIPWEKNFAYLAGALFVPVALSGLGGVLIFWGAWKTGKKQEQSTGQAAAWAPSSGRLVSGFPQPKEPETPPTHPPARRGWWFWVVQTFLFPVRLAGLLLVCLVIPGFVMLWGFPDLADKNDLDLFYLTLRVVQLENAGRPLDPLGYRRAIQARMIDLNPPLTESERKMGAFFGRHPTTVAVQTTRTPDGGYEHRGRCSDGRTLTVHSLSPHLTVPADEIAHARRGVRRIFNPRDRARWADVVAWGESLYWACWIDKQELDIVPQETIPEPAEGTPDERLWCVWRVLVNDNPAAEEDLLRLPELFEQTFPREEDRATALRWAQTFCTRAEEEFQSFRRNSASKKGNTEQSRRHEVYRSFRRVLPPEGQWTHLWLLYQYVGLSPSSQEAARRRWLGYFPEANHEKVLAMGERIVGQRRAAEEALPNVPEVLPALCVVERLTGSDPYGKKCRALLDATLGRNEMYPCAEYALQTAYPNDDFFYLAASRDPFHLHPVNIEGSTLWKRILRVLSIVLVVVVVSMGFQALLDWVVARLFIHKDVRPLWQKYRTGRGRDPLWAKAVGVSLATLTGVLTARFTLPEGLAVQIGSFGELFLGALTVTTVGGILIATCRQVLAIVLTHLGIDVEKTWLDEVLGVLAGSYLLFHFGNDLLSIGLAVLSDVIGGILEHVSHRDEAPAPPASAPLKSFPGQTSGVGAGSGLAAISRARRH